jgi:ATP-dependent exoDNAse (exonuclease V) alpha subunit
MPPRGASFSLGLVAQRGLQAKQCKLLRASTERHARLNLRMRSEDVALELSNHALGEPNAARVYEVLVSTGKGSVRLALRAHDELTVRLPVVVAGRRELVDVPFEVRQVRAVVAGLRSSELVHRAIVLIAATSD